MRGEGCRARERQVGAGWVCWRGAPAREQAGRWEAGAAGTGDDRRERPDLRWRPLPRAAPRCWGAGRQGVQGQPPENPRKHPVEGGLVWLSRNKRPRTCQRSQAPRAGSAETRPHHTPRDLKGSRRDGTSHACSEGGPGGSFPEFEQLAVAPHLHALNVPWLTAHATGVCPSDAARLVRKHGCPVRGSSDPPRGTEPTACRRPDPSDRSPRTVLGGCGRSEPGKREDGEPERRPSTCPERPPAPQAATPPNSETQRERDVALRRPGLSHQKGTLSADGAWQHGLCPLLGCSGLLWGRFVFRVGRICGKALADETGGDQACVTSLSRPPGRAHTDAARRRRDTLVEPALCSEVPSTD